MCACIRVCMSVCVCLCLFVCVFVHVHVRACLCVSTTNHKYNKYGQIQRQNINKLYNEYKNK